MKRLIFLIFVLIPVAASANYGEAVINDTTYFNFGYTSAIDSAQLILMRGTVNDTLSLMPITGSSHKICEWGPAIFNLVDSAGTYQVWIEPYSSGAIIDTILGTCQVELAARDVNVVRISGSSQAADNESTYFKNESINLSNLTIGKATNVEVLANNAITSSVLAASATGEIMDYIWIVAKGVVEDSIDNGAANFQTSLTETTDNWYNRQFVTFLTGNHAGMTRPIADYTGASGVVFVSPGLEGGAPNTGDSIAVLSIVAGVMPNDPDSILLNIYSGFVGANIIQISGDGTAADNFETMLDGTGGQIFSLRGLHIRGTIGSDTALIAMGYGSGMGGLFYGGSPTSHGLQAVGQGSGAGAYFLGGGASSPGLYAQGGGTGMGAWFRGGTTNGDGLTLAAQGTGLDLNAEVVASDTVATGDTIAVVGTNQIMRLRGLHIRGTAGDDTAFIAIGYGDGDGFFAKSGVTGGAGMRLLGSAVNNDLVATLNLNDVTGDLDSADFADDYYHAIAVASDSGSVGSGAWSVAEKDSAMAALFDYGTAVSGGSLPFLVRMFIGFPGASPGWDTLSNSVTSMIGLYTGSAGVAGNIKDAIDAINGGSGNRLCSLFVANGSGALSSGRVRMTSGGDTYQVNISGDGFAVFNLNDATWLALAYVTFNQQDTIPQTFVVTAAMRDTITMSLFSPTPAEGDLCNVYNWVKDANDVGIPGVIITATIATNFWPIRYESQAVKATKTAKTDGSGLWQMSIYPSSLLLTADGDSSSSYQFTAPGGLFGYMGIKVTVPDSASFFMLPDEEQ